MTSEAPRPEPAAELEDLRGRLAEAEEALRAIRNGTVDAVVATGEGGERVYTLKGADRIFRQLIETMSEGALTLSADGVILYCNLRMARMLGRPLDQVLGTVLRDYLASDDRQALDDILAPARIGPSHREINLLASGGHGVPAYLSATRLQNEGAETVFCLVLTDLTEQKSHEQVVAAERLARQILERAAEAIIVCDQQGRVIRANHAAERYCGGSPLLRLFSDALPLQTDASVPFYLSRALQGETLRNLDVTLDRQGQVLDLILSAGPLVSGQEILGCVVTLTDITERKRVDEALRTSQQVIEGILNAMPVRVFWKDGDLLYLGCNEAFARDAGFADPEEIIGKDDYQMGWRDQADLYRADDLQVIESGCAKLLIEESQTTLAGNKITILTSKVPLRSSEGEVSGVLGTYFDITERKKVEADSFLQSAALNAAADAIVITGRDGAIEWSNPAFGALTGYGVEEAVGKNLLELIKSGVHDTAVYKQLWETILGGQVWRGEMTNRRKDGSYYPEEQTITPVKDAAGAVAHFIAIKRDLTEERRLQAQFLQSQKMESVGRLAGGIAHDFNNLLTVINGTAEMSSLHLREADPLRLDLVQIRQAGERAASLTRQLLAFSRRQIMEVEVLCLGRLVAEMQGMLQRLIGENIDLVVVPANGADHVRADRGQLEQVVLNLVVNSRDAMEGGGTLTIETRAVELDENYTRKHPLAQPGSYVMLSVSDTGIGMDEATRAQMFEPFFTTKELGQGTGLGLSTVDGIVKQSAGSIEVYSEPGRGTTFKIYLPRVGRVEPAAQAASPVAETSATETVFVVEDEKALRELANRILKSAGYTVLTFGTAEEALPALTRHEGPVHLLLTDVILPGMSGRELATQLADFRPEIKVLYSSGYTDDAIMRHGVLEKTSHFLAKPYTVAELKRKVRAVLDS